MISSSLNKPPLPNLSGGEGLKLSSGTKNRDALKETASQPANIMYDRRIYRGSTYAAPVAPASDNIDPVEFQKQQELKKRIRAKRYAEAQRRIPTPDPVDGRKNMDIQTEQYLEELDEKVPEAIAATQTDAFLDRAPTPLFVPQKSGIDATTQVQEGELFDFEFEVQPLLEVLVGKTIEQALMEVHEEEELRVLRRRQVYFESKRNVELAEVQRLEDTERRRTEEKERRISEQHRLKLEKQEIALKISARAFAQSYLQNLVPSVFDSLTTNGYFFDVVEKEVKTSFIPWLNEQVQKEVNSRKLAIKLVDDIIRSAIRAKHSF